MSIGVKYRQGFNLYPQNLLVSGLYTWNKQTLAWGYTLFLIRDTLKILLAAFMIPSIWKIFGSVRNQINYKDQYITQCSSIK
jgi:hypothetical protein